MTTPNVYGRTTPMTLKEKAAFDAATELKAQQAGANADTVRAQAAMFWQKIVDTIGMESPPAPMSSPRASKKL